MIVIPLLRYLINVLIDAYLFVLFIRMIVDWAMILMPRWYPRGVVSSLIRVIYALTEPPLRWLRRYIPPLPMGRIQLDVSFIVLYFILIVIQILI
ncbi:YggT family protein [Bifidobacterium sp. W8108]|uniref:YggT family protein n=1 Tax=unclassified Bifidobacterium TaxID=2608897 RepID=UPI0018DC1854|nr:MULTISPECIES: YggT family protein [unclassified Bifidobacterium]MBH9979083.1 YggT family protein [Bifidobacterium sp. W8108]MBI0173045.1 YggT family protein [Bifidobacterium sp. M0307]